MKNILRTSLSNQRGFSIAETTIVMTALAVLGGVAAPGLDAFVSAAKLTRANSDVRTVSLAFLRMSIDVGPDRAAGRWTELDLLVGDGAAPETTTPNTAGWATAQRVGHLEDHLVTNNAGYVRAAEGRLGGWRGAYVGDGIGSDPWGNRYAVNVAALRSDGSKVVVLLSAGPDGVATKPFTGNDNVAVDSDDVSSVVLSGVR